MSIKFKYSKKIKNAKNQSLPILALESTIISHGMPYPKNLEFALKAEERCIKYGVVPATIAIIKGRICIGLEKAELELIAKSNEIKKISMRDIGTAVGLGWSGATTVSSTSWIAQKNNINVFSTGGLGGVHRGAEHSFDISQDLIALSKTPIVVVSSGVKSILDIQKTVELLETLGVSILGYKTSDFPAFFSSYSGVGGIHMVKSPKEIIKSYNTGLEIGLRSAMLVLNPVSIKDEIPYDEIEVIIKKAQKEMVQQKIFGKMVTPFLLNYIVKKTKGRSLKTNISLALNNVVLGAKIAKELKQTP